MKTEEETQKRFEEMRTFPELRSDWHRGYVKALGWVLEVQSSASKQGDKNGL